METVQIKKLLKVGKKYQADSESPIDSLKLEKIDFEVLAKKGDDIFVFAYGQSHNLETKIIEILREKKYTARELAEGIHLEVFDNDPNDIAEFIDDSISVLTIEDNKLKTCVGYEIKNIVENNIRN
jgi:deoxyxylulose-5-phosphate synthase